MRMDNTHNQNSNIALNSKTSSDSWKIPLVVQESGEVYWEDCRLITNLLVTGATGFGKTSFVLSMLANIMKDLNPSEVKFIIFDSKCADYSSLKKSPFLLLPVITDLKKLEGAINWMVVEGKRRMQQRSIQQLNETNYPDIFLIIDDFYSCYELCSDSLNTLLMLGRSVRLHCIIVSSTITRKTLTKEMSNNIFNRISFYLVDKATSRFILDQVGAERLMEPGDMIYKMPGGVIKGKAVFVNDDEINKICAQYEATYDVIQSDNTYGDKADSSSDRNNVEQVSTDDLDDRYDEYFEDAARLVIEKDKASIGNLQRVFRIGFNRSARIMDQLEEAGVVGPEEGTKPRRILMTMEQFDEYMGT